MGYRLFAIAGASDSPLPYADTRAPEPPPCLTTKKNKNDINDK